MTSDIYVDMYNTLGGTFCYKKKTTKNHTFSNRVAKISYLKTPFKKTATKVKKFYLVQSQSQSKKVNTRFTYFWSSKAHPSQAQCLQRRSRKNTHDHYTPIIFSGKVEQLKKKRKRKKVTNCSIWKSKSASINLKQVSKTMHDTETDSSTPWLAWWKEKGPLCSISFYLQCFGCFQQNWNHLRSQII